MPRPDEGMIHAWLDGELDALEAERVAKLVAEDPEWSAAAAEARGLIAASARIVSALDAVPSGVLPAGTRAAPPAKSRFAVRPWMRIAAGFVLVAGTATAVWTRTANTPAPGEMAKATAEVLAEPMSLPAIAPAAASTAPDEVRAPLRDASRETGVAAAAAKTGANAATAGAAARAEVLTERLETEKASLDRAMRAPATVAALSARREARVAEGTDLSATLTGCWRVQIAGRADTVLLDPQIARQSGDTLTLIVSADGRLATVHLEGSDTVRGRTTSVGAAGAAGAATESTTLPVTLIATRVACPRAP